MEMAGVDESLDRQAATILKDNISWHFPLLSANTSPWQLEGTILGLKAAGLNDLVAVHNNTVVTDPFKGGRLNKLEPIYRRHGIPEKYNFLPKDITWEEYQPEARMRVLTQLKLYILAFTAYWTTVGVVFMIDQLFKATDLTVIGCIVCRHNCVTF